MTPETMATTAMNFPPPVPPKITLAPSANGLVDFASAGVAIMPNNAMDEMRYITVAAPVPRMVARGIVVSGSLTSSAGTVADSRPMNAHSVSNAALVMPQSKWWVSVKGVKLSVCM